jgi:hypothetical protein
MDLVLKTSEQQCSVGSNPTPSARVANTDENPFCRRSDPSPENPALLS